MRRQGRQGPGSEESHRTEGGHRAAVLQERKWDACSRRARHLQRQRGRMQTQRSAHDEAEQEAVSAPTLTSGARQPESWKNFKWRGAASGRSDASGGHQEGTLSSLYLLLKRVERDGSTGAG